jgi:hypothetical protein
MTTLKERYDVPCVIAQVSRLDWLAMPLVYLTLITGRVPSNLPPSLTGNLISMISPICCNLDKLFATCLLIVRSIIITTFS